MIKLLAILFVKQTICLNYYILNKISYFSSKRTVFQLLGHFLYINISSLNKYFKTFCVRFLKTLTLSLKFLDQCYFTNFYECFYVALLVFILFCFLFSIVFHIVLPAFTSFYELIYFIFILTLFVVTRNDHVDGVVAGVGCATVAQPTIVFHDDTKHFN